MTNHASFRVRVVKAVAINKLYSLTIFLRAIPVVYDR